MRQITQCEDSGAVFSPGLEPHVKKPISFIKNQHLQALHRTGQVQTVRFPLKHVLQTSWSSNYNVGSETRDSNENTKPSSGVVYVMFWRRSVCLNSSLRVLIMFGATFVGEIYSSYVCPLTSSSSLSENTLNLCLHTLDPWTFPHPLLDYCHQSVKSAYKTNIQTTLKTKGGKQVLIYTGLVQSFVDLNWVQLL